MIASFLGGLALFLYGQFLLERNIQKTSRLVLRAITKLLTRRRITAILAGSFLTIGMQSSTIPALTMIDLINIGVLKLGGAFSIVMGVSIGTTIIVQMISFNLAGYALWFIIIGFLISRLCRYSQGELLVGLGFMFYGIYLMGRGVAFLGSVSINPMQNMLGAFILAIASQSTLAPMAVGVTLVREGGLGLSQAIPIILGSHIGAGVLPLIYSWRISGTTTGRQLGIANLIYRILGVLVFLPLIWLLADVSHGVTQWFGAGPGRQLANAHTLFTLATVGLFIPFIAPYMWFIKKIVPFRELPPVQEDLSGQEIRLAEEVYKILNDSMRLWDEDSPREIEKIEKQCFSIRLLKEGILKYATDISLLETVNNLVKISDIIGCELINLARKRILQGLDFSIEGLNEVLAIHRRIIEEFRNPEEKDIDSLISESFSGHINRMRKGFRETQETSSLHTDALTVLEHLHWHVREIK